MPKQMSHHAICKTSVSIELCSIFTKGMVNGGIEKSQHTSVSSDLGSGWLYTVIDQSLLFCMCLSLILLKAFRAAATMCKGWGKQCTGSRYVCNLRNVILHTLKYVHTHVVGVTSLFTTDLYLTTLLLWYWCRYVGIYTFDNTTSLRGTYLYIHKYICTNNSRCQHNTYVRRCSVSSTLNHTRSTHSAKSASRG